MWFRRIAFTIPSTWLALLLTPLPSRAPEGGGSRGWCAWCSCCDGNCDELEGNYHPKGISENQPCFDRLCPLTCAAPQVDFELQDISDFGGVYEAIVSATGTELWRILQRNPQFLYFNSAWGAIQALGCEGGVIAHFPLTTSQLAELNVAAASTG